MTSSSLFYTRRGPNPYPYYILEEALLLVSQRGPWEVSWVLCWYFVGYAGVHDLGAGCHLPRGWFFLFSTFGSWSCLGAHMAVGCRCQPVQPLCCLGSWGDSPAA